MAAARKDPTHEGQRSFKGDVSLPDSQRPFFLRPRSRNLKEQESHYFDGWVGLVRVRQCRSIPSSLWPCVTDYNLSYELTTLLAGQVFSQKVWPKKCNGGKTLQRSAP